MNPSAYKTVLQHSFTIRPEHIVWLDQKASELVEIGEKANMSSVLRSLIDDAMAAEKDTNREE